MGKGALRLSFACLIASLILSVGFPAVEAKEAQTIKMGRISKKKYGDEPFLVTASASSKLPVSIFVNGPASVDKKGVITIKGAGKVRVFAVQMGGFILLVDVFILAPMLSEDNSATLLGSTGTKWLLWFTIIFQILGMPYACILCSFGLQVWFGVEHATTSIINEYIKSVR